MKSGSLIKILKDNNYEKTDIKVYQHLIEKLIYLSCGTRLEHNIICKAIDNTCIMQN